jgi:ribose transport system permease protein
MDDLKREALPRDDGDLADVGSAGAPGPGATDPGRGGVAKLYAGRLGMPAFLVAMFVLFSLAKPGIFFTSSNLIAIIGSQETIIFLAVGVTLTLRLGDLDLSFASVMVTSALITAVLSAQHHVNIGLAMLAGLAFGALAGLVNAGLVVGVGLNGFVATLGTMTVAEGIGYGVSNSNTVLGVSTGLQNAIQDKNLGIPNGVWLGWLVLLIMWFVYQRTPFGRLLLFIGGNREAARLLGLPVATVRVTAYVLSGIVYALGGMILLGSIGSADPSLSPQYLLPPLAAAFLGTTTIQLGRFNILGTLIGAYVLATITTGLQLLGASSWIGYVFNGAALIAAIVLARLVRGSAAGGGALGV